MKIYSSVNSIAYFRDITKEGIQTYFPRVVVQGTEVYMQNGLIKIIIKTITSTTWADIKQHSLSGSDSPMGWEGSIAIIKRY